MANKFKVGEVWKVRVKGGTIVTEREVLRIRNHSVLLATIEDTIYTTFLHRVGLFARLHLIENLEFLERVV